MVSQIATVLGESTNAFALVGVIAASYIAVKCVGSLWTGLRAYVLGSGIDFKKMGPWAAVTGATDGIGRAYAQELAGKGLNIILISRNPEKLSDAASEIEIKYKVQTKCVAMDFSGGPEIYDKIRDLVKEVEIGVLVNNVGMSYDYPEYFASLPYDQKVHDIINVNVTSLTMMTKLVLPSMVERQKGVVINVASFSGVKPTPLLAEYSATKAYVDCFSQCLHAEYKSKGIIIQGVLPLFVATKMSKMRKTNWFVPGPHTYAQSAVGTVGVQSSTFGCVAHEVQGAVLCAMPQWLYNTLTIPQLLAARKRALNKLQKTE